jgi:general secretion pathway protein D
MAKIVKFFDKEPWTSKDDNKKIPVNCNFNSVSVGDVIPAFSDMLGFSYISDPGLKGTVTMSLSAKLTKREIWEVFENVMLLSGIWFSPSNGKMLTFRTIDKMPEDHYLFDKAGAAKGAGVLDFQLRHTEAAEAAAQVKPFMTPGGTILELKDQNRLIIVESPENLGKLGRLLRLIDRPVPKGEHRVVMHCVNAPAKDIAEELGKLLPMLGFPAAVDKDKVRPGMIKLTTVERMQTIVGVAATGNALKELQHWMEILDQPSDDAQENVFIYQVFNDKAEDLVQALSVLFNLEGSSLSAGKSGSDNAARSVKSSGGGGSKTYSSKSKNNKEEEKDVFNAKVKVFADAVHNRLIFRTSTRTYAMIKAVLDRLDVAPAQVLLQVLVAEVNLNDTTDFGTEFNVAGAMGNSAGASGGTNYKTLNPGGSTEYGANLLIFNPNSPDEKYAYLKASAWRNRVKVISSPQLLVVSHAEAKISVGNRVPVISSQLSDTSSTQTTGTTLLQTVQYIDTGIILTITPHVTQNGLITIEMDQTVSDAIENKTSSIDSPEIQERTLKTSMSLEDGQTMIVGGLIREKKQDSLDSVPFLIDIPWVNRLLGNTYYSKEKTEMIIMITGHIVTRKSKLEKLLRQYREAVLAIHAFQNPDSDKELKKKVN